MAEIIDASLVNTTCPYCGVGCGVRAEIAADGRVRVRGDTAHPANFGRLCSKGSALIETIDLEGRLLHPQIGEARALQGLGAAAGLVIPRAIITDRYQGREVAKLFSALLQVMMIAPIVAPPIGGLLVAAMGWQAIFWFLALFGAASLVALLKIVPETLESSRRATAGLRVTLLDYAGLFRRGRLAWLTLSSAFAMAGLFAYIGSSSFVFVDRFGLSPAIYSLVLAGIAVGMVIGGQINVLLLSRWTEHQILVFGLLLHAACCVALLIATLAMGAGVYVAGTLIFLAMASLMLVVGNGIALVMKSALTSHVGSVSSLLGVLQYASLVSAARLWRSRMTPPLPPSLRQCFCVPSGRLSPLSSQRD